MVRSLPFRFDAIVLRLANKVYHTLRVVHKLLYIHLNFYFFFQKLLYQKIYPLFHITPLKIEFLFLFFSLVLLTNSLSLLYLKYKKFNINYPRKRILIFNNNYFNTSTKSHKSSYRVFKYLIFISKLYVSVVLIIIVQNSRSLNNVV